jgi:hypothetical protein
MGWKYKALGHRAHREKLMMYWSADVLVGIYLKRADGDVGAPDNISIHSRSLSG